MGRTMLTRRFAVLFFVGLALVILIDALAYF